MTGKDYLRFIVNKIHSVVIATVDDGGLPVTCAIDMMYTDENSLYFLTAKGKKFYDRLIKRKYLAFTAMKGENTMSSVAVSVRGSVREIGPEMLPLLFEKNPYMNEIYPTELSKKALTVFQIYQGSGEWFDLSKKPIERAAFIFGGAQEGQSGYFINENCIGCGSCISVCPQNCIQLKETTAFIHQNNCLHCGGCMNVCPVNAVERR